MPLNRTNFANRRTIFEFSAENAKSADWLAERRGFEPAKPFPADTLTRLAHLFPPVIVIPLISGATAPVDIFSRPSLPGPHLHRKFGLEGRSPRAAQSFYKVLSLGCPHPKKVMLAGRDQVILNVARIKVSASSPPLAKLKLREPGRLIVETAGWATKSSSAEHLLPNAVGRC